MALTQQSERLKPVRGLVLAENRRGKAFGRRDVERWLRLNRSVFNAEKADLLIAATSPRDVVHYLAYANEHDMKLSLRSSCTAPPPDLRLLAKGGLFDVFLTPATLPSKHFDTWVDAARAAGLPIRLQLHAPLDVNVDPEVYADAFAEAGVCAVNLATHDAFVRTDGCTTPKRTAQTIDYFTALASALEEREIETNLLWLPFCSVPEEHRARVASSNQFFRDHQHYVQGAYELAKKLQRRGAVSAGKALLMLQGQYLLFEDPIDKRLLPWLIDSPWLRARVVAGHKLTRHLRLARNVPKPIEETEEAYEQALRERERQRMRDLGPQCGACSLRSICDRITPELRAAMPGIKPAVVEGDAVSDAMHFARAQCKYYDAIDSARLTIDETWAKLAAEANDIVANLAPDREIDSFDYGIEGQWAHQLPGGVRWFGFTNSEKLSTALATLDPPFTVSVVIGGGTAEFIGFSLGREARVLCPMETFRHRLVLHVDREGRYVLLRDGSPVRPAEFEGAYHAPLRLGDRVEPRIAIWNIDNSLVTQNVAVWSESLRAPAPETAVKISVVTVCVRYARRLQAVLQSVAHQQGIDLAEIEVIVAYVPGVDSTDDLLDTFGAAHPELRIRRSTFAEQKASAKGFVINESLKKARGEWVMLLDADTLIPPDLFARILAQDDSVNFVVPDGRKLLTRETTSKVLLGEIRPWECWDEMFDGAGEFRYREMDGVPIGFCQVVRRSCFDKVQYYEVDHFEGADWKFSMDMHEHFGKETRLSGAPVLHLDHGGSKWYGTSTHF